MTRPPGATALVAAGGRGTRLAPLTLAYPKALASVAHVPVLLLVLRELAAAGVARAVVLTPPGDRHLAAFLAAASPLPCAVSTTEAEHDRADWSVALAPVADDEPVLVALADELLDTPAVMRSLLAAATRRPELAVTAAQAPRSRLVRVAAVRSAPRADGGGAPSVAGGDGLVGRYRLPPGALGELRRRGGSVLDLLDALARGGRCVAVEGSFGHWDVGTPEGLARAQRDLGPRLAARAVGAERVVA